MSKFSGIRVEIVFFDRKLFKLVKMPAKGQYDKYLRDGE
jgi:hypothetical protein